MKASLKSLVQDPKPEQPEGEERSTNAAPLYRKAQTRIDTRQVSAHFKPAVAQTLKLIAVEQDRDVQEMLAEALNMLFARYGKATRAEIGSGRRKKGTI